MPNFVEKIRGIVHPKLKEENEVHKGEEVYKIAKQLIQNKSLIENIFIEERSTPFFNETYFAYLIPISQNPDGFNQIIISKLRNVKECEVDPPISKKSKKTEMEKETIHIRIINKDEELTFFIGIDKNGNEPKMINKKEKYNKYGNLDRFLAITNQLLNQQYA